MTTSGPNSAGAGVSYGDLGAVWSNAGNIVSSNNAYADVSIPDSSQSGVLIGYTFGFSIPSGATIDGIKAEIEKKAAVRNTIKDATVYLTKDATNGIGNNKAGTVYWGTADAYATYGGVADLWGTTWTAEEINDANFGLVIQAANLDFLAARTAYVDHMRITVYYTEAVSGSVIIVQQ